MLRVQRPNDPAIQPFLFASYGNDPSFREFGERDRRKGNVTGGGREKIQGQFRKFVDDVGGRSRFQIDFSIRDGMDYGGVKLKGMEGCRSRPLRLRCVTISVVLNFIFWQPLSSSLNTFSVSGLEDFCFAGVGAHSSPAPSARLDYRSCKPLNSALYAVSQLLWLLFAKCIRWQHRIDFTASRDLSVSTLWLSEVRRVEGVFPREDLVTRKREFVYW